jgi:uncharacterized membrane protein
MTEGRVGGTVERRQGVRAMGASVLGLTVVGLLGSALVAGIFYAFSSFVMPALERMPAAGGMAAMQSINITAVRPAFMSVLFGTALVCVALVVSSVRGWGESYAVPVLVGSVLYLLGAIVLTMTFHVPLNDALAALDPGAPSSAAAWTDYLSRWGAGNQARWLLPLAASGCFTAALLRA